MGSRKKIDEDSDLSKARRKGDHGRGERTRDTLNKCFNFALFLVFGIVIVIGASFAFTVSYNMFITHDYTGMIKALSYLATATGGYVISYLQSNGVSISS